MLHEDVYAEKRGGPPSIGDRLDQLDKAHAELQALIDNLGERFALVMRAPAPRPDTDPILTAADEPMSETSHRVDRSVAHVRRMSAAVSDLIGRTDA